MVANFAPLFDWPFCPILNRNMVTRLALNQNKRLLAVDPSLTCSGWALFSLANGELLGVGHLRALTNALPLATRLADLQQRVDTLVRDLKLGLGDILVCEAPTTMRDPRAALKVEQVRCIFESSARLRQLEVPGRINPRTVQHAQMGLRGPQQSRTSVKASAVSVVRIGYAAALKNLGFASDERNLKRYQDIVDAVLLGGLAVTWIKCADRSGIERAEYFEESRRSRRVQNSRRRAA